MLESVDDLKSGLLKSIEKVLGLRKSATVHEDRDVRVLGSLLSRVDPSLA